MEHLCSPRLHQRARVVFMTETIRNPHEQRLVFHDRLAQVDRDSQVLAERLAQHYSLLEFAPCQGHERDFLHRSSTTQCGELIVSCGYSTPNCGQTGERQGVGSINLILSGTIS